MCFTLKSLFHLCVFGLARVALFMYGVGVKISGSSTIANHLIGHKRPFAAICTGPVKALTRKEKAFSCRSWSHKRKIFLAWFDTCCSTPTNSSRLAFVSNPSKITQLLLSIVSYLYFNLYFLFPHTSFRLSPFHLFSSILSYFTTAMR